MKFSLWTDNGALNSKPVFDAFATGANLLRGIRGDHRNSLKKVADDMRKEKENDDTQKK